MKKHILTLFCLSLIFVTNTSCDNDDEGTTPEPVITATNYIYEGDLRGFYLTTEIAQLNADIDIWNQVPENDPGYEEAQENIEIANLQIGEYESEMSTIPTPDSAFLIPKPILPPVPTPSPCVCYYLYNSIENIVLLPGTDQISISIYSYNDESNIVNTDSNTPIEDIPGSKNNGRYQPFTFEQPGFVGEAFIVVQSDSDSYTIHVNFEKLP
ncbi:hypothetical protein OS188_07615 [Xanthomarina sp. F1114]|uniref:hypothetical protein n=1 Tax=Xanthomarina sp. F1114 TaxID=2996019 RepID=UPI00225DFC56|nr:hypothetical protein [Xanthomarina sp. F1114]MCX7547816.1 hypothetical protein [Xanthomarina sp. F1114]